MIIEIKHRISGKILLCGKYESIKNCLEKNRGAYLQGAYLRGADLRSADLQGAYLQGADLRGAYLQGAYLRGAYLQGAYLRGADLRGAYLQGADLRGADLRGEKLTKCPLQILGLKYFILITVKNIKIGCEHHAAEEWEEFLDDKIERMDNGALEWWKTYKPIIMALHKEHVKDVS